MTGATPGAQLTLVNGEGKTVATRPANRSGGLLFRNVKPGSGYRVRPAAGGEASSPLTVLSTQPGAAEHRHLQPVDPRRTATAT